MRFLLLVAVLAILIFFIFIYKNKKKSCALLCKEATPELPPYEVSPSPYDLGQTRGGYFVRESSYYVQAASPLSILPPLFRLAGASKH